MAAIPCQLCLPRWSSRSLPGCRRPSPVSSGCHIGHAMKSRVLGLACAAGLAAGCQSPTATALGRWKASDKSQDDVAQVSHEADAGLPGPSQRRSNNSGSQYDSSFAAGEKALLQFYRDKQDKPAHLQRARINFEAAATANPMSAEAQHRLAIVADLQERYRDSENYYRTAISMAPGNAEIAADLGWSYMLQERYADAERALNKALEIQPSHPIAREHLASCRQRMASIAANNPNRNQTTANQPAAIPGYAAQPQRDPRLAAQQPQPGPRPPMAIPQDMMGEYTRQQLAAVDNYGQRPVGEPIVLAPQRNSSPRPSLRQHLISTHLSRLHHRPHRAIPHNRSRPPPQCHTRPVLQATSSSSRTSNPTGRRRPLPLRTILGSSVRLQPPLRRETERPVRNGHLELRPKSPKFSVRRASLLLVRLIRRCFRPPSCRRFQRLNPLSRPTLLFQISLGIPEQPERQSGINRASRQSVVRILSKRPVVMRRSWGWGSDRDNTSPLWNSPLIELLLEAGRSSAERRIPLHQSTHPTSRHHRTCEEIRRSSSPRRWPLRPTSSASRCQPEHRTSSLREDGTILRHSCLLVLHPSLPNCPSCRHHQTSGARVEYQGG